MDKEPAAATPVGQVELPGPKWFQYLVFFTPLLLIVEFWPSQLIGLFALGHVLTRPWSAARRDPVLVAFLVFALVVLASDQLGGKALRAVTAPYTGWLATPPYDASIFFAVVALAFGIPRFRWAVAAMCLIQVAMGSHEWVVEGARESPNPYLRISSWRPVWTVILPLVWATGVLVWRPRAPAADDSGKGVLSPPPNDELQRTRPAQAMEPRR